MCAKRAWTTQKEVTDQYKVPQYNPPVEHFDRNTKFRPTQEVLKQRYDAIRRAVGCPEEAEEKPEALRNGTPWPRKAATILDKSSTSMTKRFQPL